MPSTFVSTIVANGFLASGSSKVRREKNIPNRIVYEELIKKRIVYEDRRDKVYIPCIC